MEKWICSYECNWGTLLLMRKIVSEKIEEDEIHKYLSSTFQVTVSVAFEPGAIKRGKPKREWCPQMKTKWPQVFCTILLRVWQKLHRMVWADGHASTLLTAVKILSRFPSTEMLKFEKVCHMFYLGKRNIAYSYDISQIQFNLCSNFNPTFAVMHIQFLSSWGFQDSFQSRNQINNA